MRDAADEQRRDPGGHRLLRPGEAAVPEQEEEAAEDEAGDDLGPTDAVAHAVSARQCPGEQDAPGDQVADGHGEQRRQVADRDRERDEGRAPDDVDRHQGEPDPRRVPRSHDPSMPVAGPSAQVEFPGDSITLPDRHRGAPVCCRAPRCGEEDVRGSEYPSSSTDKHRARLPRWSRSSTRSDGRCGTCGSRSPTAATSAASTACRRRSSGATTLSSPRGAAHVRGDRAPRARLRRARREKIRLTGGEPLLRRDLETLVGMLAPIDGPRPDADDERLPARPEGPGAQRTRACTASPSASTRSTTTSSGR